MEPKNLKNKTSTGVSDVGMDENGVVWVLCNEGVTMTLADAQKSTEVIEKVTNKTQRPQLVDFGKLQGIDRQAREYFAKDARHIAGYNAVAIIMNSPITTVVANFFMGLNKPLRPTRLFTTREAAYEWLAQFTAGAQGSRKAA